MGVSLSHLDDLLRDVEKLLLLSTLKRQAGVLKFLWFEERFLPWSQWFLLIFLLCVKRLIATCVHRFAAL